MSSEQLRALFWHDWYAARYGLHGLEPPQLWDHYRAVGRPEGLCPNPLFDPRAYLDAAPDVAAAGVDPLQHYLQNGWWEQRSTGVPLPGVEAFTPEERAALEVFFWPEWYVAQLPPGWRSGLGAGGALLHCLRLGVMLQLDPNPLFSVRYYARWNPGLLEAAGCPTLHYLRHGGLEGRACHPLVQPELLPSDASGLHPPLVVALQRFLAGDAVRFNSLHRLEPLPAGAGRLERMQQLAAYAAAERPAAHPLVIQAFAGDDLPELQWREQQQRPAPELEAAAEPVQAIAFYLPQFHRIAENDAWWGEGFTDWRNAERARPFYRGQLQPQLPHGDLGCYDLADPAVLRRQAALAQRYGIGAFCFYHYWFDGRLLLETPLQHWLADPSIALPLCLCWANETWSRRWDGRPQELLIEQTYAEGYAEGLAASLLPALRDPRYLRWNGRPVLLVYRPGDLPDAAAFARDLRAALAAAGIAELELLGVWSFDRLDPHAIGFDGAVQFAPLQVPTPNLAEEPQLAVQCTPDDAPKIYAYAEAIRHGLAEAEQPRSFPLYSGLCPSWDNTARRGGNSVSWIGATPARFERWLRLARWRTQAAVQRGELRAPALFINAWNEWGEGCHLEPDQHWGYGWLEAVQAGVQPMPALRAGSAAFRAALAQCESPVLVDGLFWQSGQHGGGHYGLAVLWQLVAALEREGPGAPRRRLWLALDPERPVDPRLRDLLTRQRLQLLAVRDVQAIADVVNQGWFATFFAPAIVAYSGYRYGETSGGRFLLEDGPTRVVGTLHDVRDWQLAAEGARLTALRGYGR
ncbi:MAG: glycoside hydrolase family 99-like domain-containing protein, partial [Synechococcaceae cyanobacterium]|nr:glycoside hydrolase family 99-like domain-containing protein [Synechococcaceae cyanobacterium]